MNQGWEAQSTEKNSKFNRAWVPLGDPWGGPWGVPGGSLGVPGSYPLPSTSSRIAASPMSLHIADGRGA